tara:strand:- start:163 stop:348 length:186 start_codon:yes stop_codon:yes gene_type:complete
MGIYESIFITTLVGFIGFLAWRVYLIETNHLTHIEKAITEIQTDIKWLVKFHQDENQSKKK